MTIALCILVVGLVGGIDHLDQGKRESLIQGKGGKDRRQGLAEADAAERPRAVTRGGVAVEEVVAQRVAGDLSLARAAREDLCAGWES